MRFYFSLFFCFFPFFIWGHVLVSVPPQKFIIERLTDKKIHVEVIVPKGVSPHSYEPTPRDIERLKDAQLWFTTGESFEKRLSKVLETTKQRSQLEGLDLIYDGCTCHSGVDTHVWLSPRCVIGMSKIAAKELIEVFPELKETILCNSTALENELIDLDAMIRSSPLSTSVLVSHPAFSYFCRDYNIEQLSIEIEGKEPSPKQATQLMTLLREKNLKRLFFQEQYSKKAAEKFANELKLEMNPLDPYAEDVILNLKMIQEAFKAA